MNNENMTPFANGTSRFVHSSHTVCEIDQKKFFYLPFCLELNILMLHTGNPSSNDGEIKA